MNQIKNGVFSDKIITRILTSAKHVELNEEEGFDYLISHLLYSYMSFVQNRNDGIYYEEDVSSICEIEFQENGEKISEYIEDSLRIDSKDKDFLDFAKREINRIQDELSTYSSDSIKDALKQALKNSDYDSISKLISALQYHYYPIINEDFVRADFDCSTSDSLIYNIRQMEKYVGFVSDKKSYIKKLIAFYLFNIDVSFHQQDVLEYYIEKNSRGEISELYDAITFLPPPGKLRSSDVSYLEKLKDIRLSVSVHRGSDWSYIFPVLDSLKENGRCFLLLPKNTSFNISERELRKALCELRVFEAVIELQQTINTSSSQYLLYVISKKRNASIRMINATIEDRNPLGLPCTAREIENLLDVDSKHSMSVSYEDLTKDFILLPSRYIYKVDCGEDAITLKNVLVDGKLGRGSSGSFLKGTEYSENHVRCVSVADLDNGYILDVSKLKTKEYEKSDENYCIDKSGTILISKTGPDFKIAYVELKENEKILVVGNLFSIKLTNDMNPLYLLSFLISEKGSQALRSISTGGNIPNLNVISLSELQIPKVATNEMNVISNYLQDLLKIKREYSMKLEELKKKCNEIFNSVDGDKAIRN